MTEMGVHFDDRSVPSPIKGEGWGHMRGLVKY